MLFIEQVYGTSYALNTNKIRQLVSVSSVEKGG